MKQKTLTSIPKGLGYLTMNSFQVGACRYKKLNPLTESEKGKKGWKESTRASFKQYLQQTLVT